MWDVQRRARDDRPGPVRAVFLASLLVLSLALAGCRHQDVVENELRSRDFQYRELLDEMKKSEFHNQALQLEVQALRRGQPVCPEQAGQAFGLKRITLSSLTMGINSGKCPGDDALQVIVEPRDAEDHVIKVPGSVQVTAQEISPQGVKSPLASWDLDQDQVRRSWKQGLMSTGYYFKLPWQTWPQFEAVRVTVRFVLSDNRLFEADKDVKIRLAPRDLLPHPTPEPATQPPPTSSESWRPPVGNDKRSAPLLRSGWRALPLSESLELGSPTLLD